MKQSPLVRALGATTLVLFALSGAAAAQVSHTFGPERAPLGCSVVFSLSNDGPSDLVHDPTGFRVYDAQGQVVFTPPGQPPFVTLQPGEVYTQVWPQVDDQGNAVAPGTYHLNHPAGASVVVGGTHAALAPVGAPKLGSARHYRLCSPLDAGRPYQLLASTSAGSFMTCAGNLPLSRDRVFELSLGRSPVFRGFSGSLDARGESDVPVLALPPTPALVGTSLTLAFVVLDPSSTCGLRRISEPLRLALY